LKQSEEKKERNLIIKKRLVLLAKRLKKQHPDLIMSLGSGLIKRKKVTKSTGEGQQNKQGLVVLAI
jgi:hypothetical protein